MTDNKLPFTTPSLTDNCFPTPAQILYQRSTDPAYLLKEDLRAGRDVLLDKVKKMFRAACDQDDRARLNFGLVAADAAERGLTDIVDWLLTAGCPLGVPIYQRAINGKSIAVFKVLRKHGWKINDLCLPGDLPILGYIAKDLTLSDWFLNQGADPNLKNPEGITPLSLIVQAAPKETINWLFEKGGRVDQGWLLHYAVRRESEEIDVVELLLGKGAHEC